MGLSFYVKIIAVITIVIILNYKITILFGGKPLELSKIHANHFETNSSTNNQKTIGLFYGTYFDNDYRVLNNNQLELIDSYSKRYINHDIIITTNKSEIVNADFVFFHQRDISSYELFRLFKSKKPNQIWVLHTLECPNSEYFEVNYDKTFDVTINYLNEAIFTTKYGSFVKAVNSSFDFMNYKNLCQTTKKKKRMGIMITNCATHRIDLIRKFMKYFNVTVIGERSKLFGPKIKCYDYTHILKDIKFYLAFENNICKDYVTEKYFINPWKYNAVPITYNGANLTEYVSYKTAININDFNSFEELVLFIEQIDDDCDKWVDYFKWQTEYQIHEAEIFELLVDFVKKFKNRKDELIDIIKKNPFHKPSKALSRELCKPYNNYFDKRPYKL